MIISITPYEENEERENIISEAYESLIKEFNLEAKRQKSKFRLRQEEKCCLQKLCFGLLINNLGNYIINYNCDSDTFSFESGIEKDIFDEVKQILRALKQKFDCEVIDWHAGDSLKEGENKNE